MYSDYVCGDPFVTIETVSLIRHHSPVLNVVRRENPITYFSSFLWSSFHVKHIHLKEHV
jgi:hypothetical protein